MGLKIDSGTLKLQSDQKCVMKNLSPSLSKILVVRSCSLSKLIIIKDRPKRMQFVTSQIFNAMEHTVYLVLELFYLSRYLHLETAK